jgi:hypothetical protein
MDSGGGGVKRQPSNDTQSGNLSTFSLDVAHHMQSMQTFPPWPTQPSSQVQQAPHQVGHLQSHVPQAPSIGQGEYPSSVSITGFTQASADTPGSSYSISSASSPLLVARSFLSDLSQSLPLGVAQNTLEDDLDLFAEQQHSSDLRAAPTPLSIPVQAAKGLTHVTAAKRLHLTSDTRASHLPHVAGFVISSCSSRASAPTRGMRCPAASHKEQRVGEEHEQGPHVTEQKAALPIFAVDEASHRQPDQAPEAAGESDHTPHASGQMVNLHGALRRMGSSTGSQEQAQQADEASGRHMPAPDEAVITNMPFAVEDNQNPEHTTRGRLDHLAGRQAATQNAAGVSGGLPLVSTKLQIAADGSSQQEALEGMPQHSQSEHVMTSLPAAAVVAKQFDSIGASCHLLPSRELPVSTLAVGSNTNVGPPDNSGKICEMERLSSARGIGRFRLMETARISKSLLQAESTSSSAGRAEEKMCSSSSLPSDVSIQVLRTSYLCCLHLLACL